jgi:hypothetical protein
MSMMITGKDIPLFRLKMILLGLKSEMRGMRLTSKGRSCYAIAKSEFGLKGSKASVYAQFAEIVENAMKQNGELSE